MGMTTRVRHSVFSLLLLFLSACATTATPVTPPVAAVAHLAPSALKAAWWDDNRWRYRDDAEADAAYERLLTRESPWPEWHQAQVVTLPVGTRIEMALSPGQPAERPGGFATFDHIPDVRFVRTALAVKAKWKPQIDRVATFEVTVPLPADTGTVGPQIDSEAGAYLHGGGSQLEMKVPAVERIAHLKVVAVRPIR
jgi:hypothetical protein